MPKPKQDKPAFELTSKKDKEWEKAAFSSNTLRN
jgi:hypothetical protein